MLVDEFYTVASMSYVMMPNYALQFFSIVKNWQQVLPFLEKYRLTMIIQSARFNSQLTPETSHN